MTKSYPPEIVRQQDVALESFPGGATYQTVVGDDSQNGQVRIGIQTSPPGYATPHHSHPYTEILTVMSGTGTGWIEGEDGAMNDVQMEEGVTLVMPPRVRHGFRVTGDEPLVTYGLHVSPERLVDIHDDNPPEAGHPS